MQDVKFDIKLIKWVVINTSVCHCSFFRLVPRYGTIKLFMLLQTQYIFSLLEAEKLAQYHY
jgi:hypothetical protein